jgi:histidinol-phosphate aminotransferase
VNKRFWSPLALRLTPYVPGEQPRHDPLLKLNTNESPYPPSPGVLEAIAGVTGDMLLRYPDPDSSELCAAAAERFGLELDQVFAGNGSDEILAHSFAAFLGRERRLQFPDITYSFYPVWCELYDVDYDCVPLRDDFSIAPADFDHAAAAVLLPNPNAPTGLPLPQAAIERMLVDAPDRLLIVDEAYVDFGAESAVPLIAAHDNLLVVQTLSKSRALAGVRLGFAFGQAPLIEALRRVKDSFNSYPVDCLAEQAGIAALRDGVWFDDNCTRVVRTRERLRGRLEELGFEVLPSVANFLFAQHRVQGGAELFAALRERGVLLRRWDKPRIDNFLRISIGTDAQCDQLLTILEDLLAA